MAFVFFFLFEAGEKEKSEGKVQTSILKNKSRFPKANYQGARVHFESSSARLRHLDDLSFVNASKSKEHVEHWRRRRR